MIMPMVFIYKMKMFYRCHHNKINNLKKRKKNKAKKNILNYEAKKGCPLPIVFLSTSFTDVASTRARSEDKLEPVKDGFEL